MNTQNTTQQTNGRLNGLLDQPQEPITLPPRVENSILQTYFGGNMDLFNLAGDHNLDVDQLLDWLESEKTRAKIERLKQVSEKRAQDVFVFSLSTAATRLRQAASLPYVDLNELEPKDQRHLLETARKAATLIYKVNNPSPRSTASQAVQDPKSPPPSVPSSLRASVPSPSPLPNNTPTLRTSQSSQRIPTDTPRGPRGQNAPSDLQSSPGSQTRNAHDEPHRDLSLIPKAKHLPAPRRQDRVPESQSRNDKKQVTAEHVQTPVGAP